MELYFREFHCFYCLASVLLLWLQIFTREYKLWQKLTGHLTLALLYFKTEPRSFLRSIYTYIAHQRFTYPSKISNVIESLSAAYRFLYPSQVLQIAIMVAAKPTSILTNTNLLTWLTFSVCSTVVCMKSAWPSAQNDFNTNEFVVEIYQSSAIAALGIASKGSCQMTTN